MSPHPVAKLPVVVAPKAPVLLARRVLDSSAGEIVGATFWNVADEDSLCLVLVTANGAVQFWDAQHDTLQSVLVKQASKKLNEITCAAFVPQEGLIVTGHEDGAVHLRAIERDAQRNVVRVRSGHAIEAHRGSVRALAVSSEGMLLYSGGSDGAIIVMALRGHCGRNEPQVLIEGSNDLTALSLSPNDALLAAALDDGAVQVWRLPAGADKARLEWKRTVHRFRVRSLAFAPNGNMLASGGYDGAMQVLAARSGHELQILPGHPTGITAVAFAPDSRTIAVVDSQGGITLHDGWVGTLRYTLPALSEGGRNLVFSRHESEVLLAATSRHEVALWRVPL